MNKHTYTHYSDEALMVLIQDRQLHAAIDELHNRYSKKLLGYFVKMLNKDYELAQDFVQDIFLKILEKHHLFNPEKRFNTWLFTIASNMCKTNFRSFGKLISLETKHETSEITDNAAEKALFLNALEQGIQTLDHLHKTVFVLRFLEHFSLNEIAEILDCSLGTVKSRLFYATKKMTIILKDFNPLLDSTAFKTH